MGKPRTVAIAARQDHSTRLPTPQTRESIQLPFMEPTYEARTRRDPADYSFRGILAGPPPGDGPDTKRACRNGTARSFCLTTAPYWILSETAGARTRPAVARKLGEPPKQWKRPIVGNETLDTPRGLSARVCEVYWSCPNGTGEAEPMACGSDP